MDTKERRNEASTTRRATHVRAMKPWGIQTTTAGDRVDTRCLSEHTLVLAVTSHYYGKKSMAATALSRDSVRALRDNLSAFLDR